jgi:outer membrane protein OmpA-like peptidoglycan-associated protein
MKPLVGLRSGPACRGSEPRSAFGIPLLVFALSILFALSALSCGKGSTSARPSNEMGGPARPAKVKKGDPSQPGAASMVWSYTAMPAPAPDGKPDRLLRSFGFAEGSTSLDREATAVILDLITYLQGEPKARVLVVGFSDPAGEKENADNLGQKRAEAVQLMLGQGGIAKTRILTGTFGISQCKADPSDPVAVAKERRGEVWLLE